jgi:hypothetical protein
MAAAVAGVVVVAGAATVSLDASHRRVVLGSRHFGISVYAQGWGSERPAIIYNGGDPSGMISSVRWDTWGGRIARGRGKTSIFAPTGGYYPTLVRIQLRASSVGRCDPRGPLAYLALDFRVPDHPGGKLGRWQSWTRSATLCRPPGR